MYNPEHTGPSCQLCPLDCPRCILEKAAPELLAALCLGVKVFEELCPITEQAAELQEKTHKLFKAAIQKAKPENKGEDNG